MNDDAANKALCRAYSKNNFLQLMMIVQCLIKICEDILAI